MRLILSYLFHKFSFALAPPYDALMDTTTKAEVACYLQASAPAD